VRLYSAEDLATLLKVDLATLYRYARRGDLKGVKIGKFWRFTEEDVSAFVESRRVGAPAPVRPTRPLLLTDLLRDAAHGSPASSGIAGSASRLGYADVDARSDRLAHALAGAGVGKGDRVFCALANSPEFVVACFGVWKTGAILVPEESVVRAEHFRHVLRDSRPTALILDRSAAESFDGLGEPVEGLRLILVKDRTFSLSGLEGVRVESLDAILDSGEPWGPFPRRAISPEDPASITYTSGSAGVPKGVLNTHQSWLAGAEFTVTYARIGTDDRVLVPLPLHHGLAFRQILAYARAHASVIVASDIYQAMKLMKEERPTALVLVPAACNILLDHFPQVLAEADAFLRYVEIGSAAIAPERFRRLREVLPTTALHLPYGLTEARVAYLTRGSEGLINRIASVSPGLELAVVDEFGAPVGPGGTGEIRLRGVGLMKGYWGRTDEEHAALARDGFRTGDGARVDGDGAIELLGRLDDMLKIGGRKVNPAEVEMALNRHPGVALSAVIGLPDPAGIFENQLHAFVVPKDRVRPVGEDDLAEHCRRHLEPHKVPARFHLRSALPLSAVGKVLRKSLDPGPAGGP
jgi:excisionase family DNA binding protein